MPRTCDLTGESQDVKVLICPSGPCIEPNEEDGQQDALHPATRFQTPMLHGLFVDRSEGGLIWFYSTTEQLSPK